MDEYSTGISMKESHTHCVCCGRNISTALAKRYAGGCSKCYEEKTSSVEPKNFNPTAGTERPHPGAGCPS